MVIRGTWSESIYSFSSQPDIETLAKIAKLLNVGVEELYNKKFMESV